MSAGGFRQELASRSVSLRSYVGGCDVEFIRALVLLTVQQDHLILFALR